ncbi:hypothetical protein SAICODRAFT_128814 [Saitoella complicata NRRL Y-17804]|uniref:uncharacterized protein n=1 Tax=Saitoella complicata (strain BCRC 22490 / CBS 7301 / JCM 7358 / NBRC 10748 / NRRL Y-17804) TaxID=698492 RepID=UPI000867F030|nr:uncharacterized protein SAICODRAFT_128814 [Saitoella complicata NRRL Y-17804]ODQ52436.1 hypothetical protein SAICODRAFT_128814 [Saitoella complicata NRRL Y-17804]
MFARMFGHACFFFITLLGEPVCISCIALCNVDIRDPQLTHRPTLPTTRKTQHNGRRRRRSTVQQRHQDSSQADRCILTHRNPLANHPCLPLSPLPIIALHTCADIRLASCDEVARTKLIDARMSHKAPSSLVRQQNLRTLSYI